MAWVFGEDQEDQKKEQGKGKSGWVFEGSSTSGDSRSLEERIRARQLEEERQAKQREEKRQEQEASAASSNSNPTPLPVAEKEEKSEPSRELQELMRDPNAGLSAFGALEPDARDNTTARAKEEYARVANVESLGSGYDWESMQKIQQQAEAERQMDEILAAARKQEEEEATKAISQLPEQQQLELYLDPNYTLTDSDKAHALELIESYRNQGLDESKSTAEQLQALQKKAKGSALGYILEKTAAGLGSSLEGAKNFLVDTVQKIPVWVRDAGEFAKTEEQLQQALNAGLDIGSEEGSAEMSRIIDEGLSQSGFNEEFEDPLEERMSALDALKSDTLKEQAALVDSRYNNPAGAVKLAGEVGGGIGGVLPSIGVNALTGGGGMAVMFASAAGNAAEEAKSEGADDTTAYIYGLLSGATEVATEKISGGIPGLGMGGTDDAVKWMLKRASASPATQQVVMKTVDVLGEGAEEYISEVVGAYLEKLYKEDDRGAWQTFVETQPDALASLLLGSLTSGVMNLGEIPGIIGNVNTERALQSGESVTERQAQNYENLVNDLYEPGTQEWQRAMDRALENASPSTRAGMRQLATDQYNAKATPDQLGSEEWYRMQMQQYRDGLASPLPVAQQNTETVQGATPLPIAGEELAGGISVQSDASRQARQKAVETGTVSEELLGYTERMAQRSGRQLEYVFEPDSPVGGSVDGEKITINLANPDYAFNTAVHEVGHTMKSGNPQQWASFEQAMLQLADSNPEMEAIARGVADAYIGENSRGLRSMQAEDGSLNEAALAEEISLKLAEEIVKDPARITQAVEQDRGMIQRLLDFVRGLKNQAMIRFGKSESAMLDEAERTLVNLLRGQAGSVTGERYSIRQDADGKPFVEIDEDILAGVPNKDKIKTVAAELRRRYPDGFNWRGWKIDLNGQGIREFTRSLDTQRLSKKNQTFYNDKLRTAANLDEIIEVADNIRNESPAHSRKDNLSSFNRADVQIRVGQNDYTAEVVTAIKPSTKEIFYDIVNLRPMQIKTYPPASTEHSMNVVQSDTDMSSMESIINEQQFVNPKESAKNSLSTTPNTESNLPWREYARQRYADLQSRMGEAQTAAIPLPVAQRNAETPQGAMPLPIAGEQTAKSRQYQTRAENRFVNEIGEALSVPGGARRNVLKPAAQQLTQEIRETGRVSAETANAVFDEVYQQGRIVLDEVYNQYKDLKTELRREPITLAQVDRDSQTYQEFRRSNFGVLNLVNEGGVPVDVKYLDLAERWPELFPADVFEPAERLKKMAEVARSIVKTEADLDTYYADDPFWKDAARESFDRSLERLQDEMGVVTRYDAEHAQKQNTRRTAAAPSVEQMQAVYRTAQQMKEKADKVVQNTLLTDADNQTVEGLLRGKISPEQVTGANSRDILRVYEAKKAVRDVMEPIRKYKAGRHEEKLSTAQEFLENSVKWKDKKIGYAYNTETMERNLRDIAGNDAKGLIDYYFTPVHKDVAALTRWKNQMRNRVRSLKLNHAESAYLQMYGELQGVEAARQMGLERSDGEIENLREQEAKYYDAHKNKIDKAKVERALKVFRGIYDEAIARMNRVYVENGYAPVEYRQGYFPHFNENKPTGWLGRIAGYFGISTGSDTLPTDIDGLTHTFKPGRKFNQFGLQRTGYQTEYDALKGLDKYLETAADVIFLTDDIQNLRALESAIRMRYSEKGVQERIREIQRNEDFTEAEKDSALEEYRKKSLGHLNGFVRELTNYTNLLAGKKSAADRGIEGDLGRGIYQTMNNIERRVAANMVAANPASWMTNFIPIVQAAAEVSPKSIVRAAKDTAKNWAKNDGFEDRSTFLTNRAGSAPASRTKKLQKLSEWMGKPMEWIDMFTANVVTRAKYYENIRGERMTPDAAMDDADSFAASIMADRSKGALPTIFARKSPLWKAVTMFQVEVNNQLRHYFKDLPQAHRDKALKVIAQVLLKYFIGAYLYNDLYEYFIGRRPAMDAIGLLNETVGNLSGYQLPNLIEAVEDLASGESPDFTVQRKGAIQAVATLGEGVAEQLPFVGGMLGGGRIPVTSVIPDIGSLSSAGTGLLSGEMAPNKAGSVILDELEKPFYYLLPPFGGGQGKKLVEGVRAVMQGGVYGLNNEGEKILRFPIEDQSIGTYIQAGLFGPYALPTGQEYAQSGFKSKSVNWTQEWEAAKEQGISFDQFEEWKELASEVRADKNEKGNSIPGTKARNLRQLLNDPRFDFTPTQRELLMQQAGYDYYTLEKVDEG